MKIQSISLIAPMLFALTACPGDDSGSDDTTGATTAPTTGGDDGATTVATTSPTTTNTTQTTADSSGDGMDTGCVPAMKTCMEGCEALYDCGAEDGNCMFTGDQAEKDTFVEGCVENPLCDTLVNLVNECDCASTVNTIKGASADFTDACDNGISGGSGTAGTDTGGSDTGGSSTGGA
jgi:hypothetical protein